MSTKSRAVRDEEVPDVVEEAPPTDILKLQPTVLVVESQYKISGKVESESTDEKQIEIRDFVVEPARVGVDFSRTRNLGDFHSVRVNVSVSVPCYREEIEAAIDHWSEFVVARTEAEIEKNATRPDRRVRRQETRHDF